LLTKAVSRLEHLEVIKVISSGIIRQMAVNSTPKQYSLLHLGKYYPPHMGGMEIHLQQLIRGQSTTIDVAAIVAGDARRTQVESLDGAKITRVASFGVIASMPVCPGLTSAIRRSPADLVHIQMPNPGAALAFLMSGHTGKLIVTHQADIIGRKLLRRLSDPIVDRLMKRAARIIITTARYRDSSSELKTFRDKCRVVPLGIDIQQAATADPLVVRQIRQQYGDRLILAVGRLVPYKGFDVLIRAMKQVDAKLLIIGTGPMHDVLTRLITTENVSAKVTLQGHVEDIRPYFAAASFFAFPSVTRAEAFGIVQLEAMAAGLPVINTNIESGVEDISLDGKTGITVPPGDESALAQAMQLLLNREDLRHQYGEAARERAWAEFSADMMCVRTMKVYDEVLST
jgi:glycosyltransferase involved in cell wall biosynthesis